MARWLQLDGKIINLDQVTLVAPRKKFSDEGGTSISLINGDGVFTSQSVEQVLRLIEMAEGPEPPLARVVDHSYESSMGGVYECRICSFPMRDHAK